MAKAYADLLIQLGNDGAIQIISDDWVVDDVPSDWKLLSFDKYDGDGETKPGPLVEDSRHEDFFDDVPPPEPETGFVIQVTGHLNASTGTIVFVWTWGAQNYEY